jgi:cytoskeletal protein CcmA (bactofilin family)
MARSEADESFINSIVGPGTFFRGHVELKGLLRIDGDFSGSVRTDGRVIVGKSGRADCAIEAGTVVVGGMFRGDILAFEKVILLSSCVVLGSVSAPRLVAEEGVLFSGRFRITGSNEALLADEDGGRGKKLLLETVRRREQLVGGTSVGQDEGRSQSPDRAPKAAATVGSSNRDVDSWKE